MKICPKCGAPQADTLFRCDCCGSYFPEAKKTMSKMCVAGFVSSLLAVGSAFFMTYEFVNLMEKENGRSSVIALILWLLGALFTVGFTMAGFILSIKGTKQAKDPLVTGSGFGIAGIFISSAMLIIASGIVLLLMLFIYYVLEGTF